MELEDLFRKQRPPKDYVSYPPQEAPTLDKFFAERTPKVAQAPAGKYNMFGRDFLDKSKISSAPEETPKVKEVVAPITPELRAVASESPKVSPERLAEIRAKLQMSPETMEMPVQQDVQNTAPVATSNLIDVRKVQRQAEELAPRASNTDLAMGLIPAAIDVLSGGYGEGMDISGKYLLGKAGELDKRKYSLEDKLMDIEKARAIAGAKGSKGSKNFQTVNIVDETDGSVVKANFDKDTGKYYSPDGKPLNSDKIRAGYAVIPEEFDRRGEVSLKNAKTKADYTPRLDPETGLYSRASESGMTPIGQQKAKLNPKQEKDLTQLTDKFISSDTFKKPAAALSVASNIDSLLDAANSGNASAANSARVQMARMSGDVGALSDTDIERTGGSPSIKAKIKRFTNLQNTGVPLTAADIEELKEIARIYEANARSKLGGAVESLDKTYVSEYGGVGGSVKSKLDAYIPKGSMSKPSQISGDVRVMSPEGVPGKVPAANLQKALKLGYKRL